MKINQDILSALKEEIAKEAGVAVSNVDTDATFSSLGLDSISSIFVMNELELKLGIEMNPMFFWDYPTVSKLAEHITSLTTHE